jgi:hypothetical protein
MASRPLFQTTSGSQRCFLLFAFSLLFPSFLARPFQYQFETTMSGTVIVYNKSPLPLFISLEITSDGVDVNAGKRDKNKANPYRRLSTGLLFVFFSVCSFCHVMFFPF